MTLDPDEGDEEEAITQNGYAYANNNPVMLADPDGEWVWLAVNAGFAAYDGYKAYKKYKKQGKRGAALWGRVAWAAGSNFFKIKHAVKGYKLAVKAGSRVAKRVEGGLRKGRRITNSKR